MHTIIIFMCNQSRRKPSQPRLRTVLSWIQAEQQPLIHVHPDVFETHRDARMLSEIAHAAATAIETEKEQRPPPKAWKRGWKRWKNVKECENMWQNEQNELEITWKVFRMGHLI
jgi:predicted membrane-bound dolichyl-phosphate-mannose-protein mannosyltransferase